MRAVVIDNDKPPRIELIDGSLESLQAAVGGYIEALSLDGFDGNVSMYVNEDGIALGLAHNPTATALAQRGGFKFLPGDFVKGNAIVVNHDEEYEATDITSEQLVAFALKFT